MNYPIESQVIVPIAWANRKLTTKEEETFIGGGGLPAGVGFDPGKVYCDYRTPDAVLHTLTYGVDAALVKDAPGAYKATLTGNLMGRWKARGRAQTSGGEVLAATKPTIFRIIPF